MYIFLLLCLINCHKIVIMGKKNYKNQKDAHVTFFPNKSNNCK